MFPFSSVVQMVKRSSGKGWSEPLCKLEDFITSKFVSHVQIWKESSSIQLVSLLNVKKLYIHNFVKTEKNRSLPSNLPGFPRLHLASVKTESQFGVDFFSKKSSFWSHSAPQQSREAHCVFRCYLPEWNWSGVSFQCNSVIPWMFFFLVSFIAIWWTHLLKYMVYTHNPENQHIP